MKRVWTAALVAASLVAAYLPVGAAEGLKLRYVAAVYADEKEGGLKLPEGVGCDGTGRLVIGDTGNNRLLRFTWRDKTISGGTEIKTPELSAPSRVQLNSKGDIYAFDGKRRRIVHLGPEGEYKDVLGFDGVPPPATIVPRSFAIDSADAIYVLDAFGSRVLVLSPAGQFQRALALPDDAGFVNDVAVDFEGTVLVLDATGRRLLSAAKDATAFTVLGGSLAEPLTTMPASMTVTKGAIFIAEAAGSAITGVGRDGSFLGKQLAKGWREGSLNHPAQLCVTPGDDVFIADRDNSRVQVFTITR